MLRTVSIIEHCLILTSNMSESERSCKFSGLDQGAGTSNDPEQLAKPSREVEELRAQSRILSREILTLQDAHKNIVTVLIKCQGLLCQLAQINVRRDFLLGKLGLVNCSDEMLLSLDGLRSVMLPKPGMERDGAINGDEAVAFVSRLLSRDAGEPMVRGAPLPIRQSFEKWRTIFQSLLDSKYWEIETVRGTVAPSALGSASSSHGPFQGCLDGEHPAEVKPGKHVKADSISHPVTRSKLVGKKHRKRHQYRQPSVSSSQSLSSRDSDSGTSGDSEQLVTRGPRRSHAREENTLAQAIKGLKFKEVVPPVVFDPKSGDSFKKFLSTYERYFEFKYTGSDRDKARHLQQYLKGEMRSCYEAIGGRNGRYEDVKRQLLSLYDADKASKREDAYRQFREMRMQESDSIRMYTLRLEQVARRAFPDASEAERQLCRKFKETASPSLRLMLAGARSTISLMGEKNLTWDRIKVVAESADRGAREMAGDSPVPFVDLEPDIGFSQPHALGERERATSYFDPPTGGFQQRSGTAPVWCSRPQMRTEYNVGMNCRQDNTRAAQGTFKRPNPVVVEHCYQPSRNFTPSRDFRPTSGNGNGLNSNHGRSRPVPTCDWCGRRGHGEGSCWEKKGTCLLCGEAGHDTSSCASWGPGHNGPRCSLCGGPHLGKNCPTITAKSDKTLN